MHVRDIMTTDVHTLSADKKIVVAREIMDWARVRHVPIVDDEGQLVGLVTHRDLLKASISNLSTSVARVEKSQHLAQISIEEIMQREVTVVPPELSVRQAARTMLEEKFGCLPVVEGTRLVGIVTEADLLKLVVDALPA